MGSRDIRGCRTSSAPAALQNHGRRRRGARDSSRASTDAGHSSAEAGVAMTVDTGSLATKVVRSWVFLYTAGLPADARRERRDEIDCDLWEQFSDADREGDAPGHAAREALGRSVRGVPADLFWRLEQRGVRQRVPSVLGATKQGRIVNASVAHKGFIGVALVFAALSVTLVLSNALAADDAWVIGEYGRSVAVLIGIGPAVTILGGLLASFRAPIVGGIAVSVGAVALAVLLSWTIVVPVLTLVLVSLCLVLVRQRPRTITS